MVERQDPDNFFLFPRRRNTAHGNKQHMSLNKANSFDTIALIIPHTNVVYVGILFSGCLLFRPSVNISRFLLNNLSSFSQILIKFTPKFNH